MNQALINGVSYRLVYINHGKSLVTLVNSSHLVSVKFTSRDYPLCTRCILYRPSDMRGLRYFCVSRGNPSEYAVHLPELCNFIRYVDAFHDECIVAGVRSVKLSILMSLYLIRLGYDRS